MPDSGLIPLAENQEYPGISVRFREESPVKRLAKVKKARKAAELSLLSPFLDKSPLSSLLSASFDSNGGELVVRARVEQE